MRQAWRNNSASIKNRATLKKNVLRNKCSNVLKIWMNSVVFGSITNCSKHKVANLLVGDFWNGVQIIVSYSKSYNSCKFTKTYVKKWLLTSLTLSICSPLIFLQYNVDWTVFNRACVFDCAASSNLKWERTVKRQTCLMKEKLKCQDNICQEV